MTTNFRHSSQFKNWFFSEDEKAINDIRENTIQTVRNTIVDHMTKNGVEQGPATANIPTLTVDEEVATVQKNIGIMSQLCDRFQFNVHVEATAMIYFKRFFLENSIMQFDINIFMLTCMFLAAKTEENHMKLDDFLFKVEEFTQSKIDKKEIQRTELILLQGLKFHLIVYHPYRSLYAFVHDFFEADRKHETAQLFDNARKFIKESYKTDVSFMYPPGTIALAALFHYNPTDTDHFIEKSYASKQIDTEHLMRSIKRIDSIVSSLTNKEIVEKSTATLKSARLSLKKLKKIIEEHKVFDTSELERIQEEKDRERRTAKIRAAALRQAAEEQELLK